MNNQDLAALKCTLRIPLTSLFLGAALISGTARGETVLRTIAYHQLTAFTAPGAASLNHSLDSHLGEQYRVGGIP
jgi:hypothetical protein